MANETLLTLDKSIDYLELLFSKLMTRFVVAAIILLMGFIIGKVMGRLIEKILHEIELDNLAKKTMRLKFSLEQAISKATAGFIYFIAGIMALSELGLATTILNILAAAVILFIVISIIISIKDIIPNIIAGLILQSKKFIKEGDHIKLNGISGKIISLTLAETRLETDTGDIISIPNSIMNKSKLTKLKRKR